MFKKLLIRIKEASRKAKEKLKQRQQKMVEQFNDEIANKTEWSPLKKGGASFKTHVLNKPTSMSLKYQVSKGGILFISIFILVGLSAMLAGVYFIIFEDKYSSWPAIMFGAIFIIIPVIMFLSFYKSTTFDLSMGIMYKGHKPPKLSGDQQGQQITYLNDVHAIQIIKEYIKTDKSSYHSYEINLVMKDASRVNVVDHGNYQQIKKDAEEISTLLGKKLWDTVN